MVKNSVSPTVFLTLFCLLFSRAILGKEIFQEININIKNISDFIYYWIRSIFSIQAYVQQYNRLQCLVRQYKATQEKHEATCFKTTQVQPADNRQETTQKQMLEKTRSVDKKTVKLQREIEKQNDTVMKAFVRKIEFKQRERQVRDGKLKEVCLQQNVFKCHVI